MESILKNVDANHDLSRYDYGELVHVRDLLHSNVTCGDNDTNLNCLESVIGRDLFVNDSSSYNCVNLPIAANLNHVDTGECTQVVWVNVSKTGIFGRGFLLCYFAYIQLNRKINSTEFTSNKITL
ncbi:hypothetical protein KFK09_014366 [Dendrobium nobile]|uniref:Uncharacterized protein n=1 Tax=Dendrobium nobile TaxID=94219 RepID=A0A8T3BBV7_DENNO|nr:hypothetical protein KFK09_014366 [Dendrobium nobile]